MDQMFSCQYGKLHAIAIDKQMPRQGWEVLLYLICILKADSF